MPINGRNSRYKNRTDEGKAEKGTQLGFLSLGAISTNLHAGNATLIRHLGDGRRQDPRDVAVVETLGEKRELLFSLTTFMMSHRPHQ